MDVVATMLEIAGDVMSGVQVRLVGGLGTVQIWPGKWPLAQLSVEVEQAVMSLDGYPVPSIGSVWEDGFGFMMVSDVAVSVMKIAFPAEEAWLFWKRVSTIVESV